MKDNVEPIKGELFDKDGRLITTNNIELYTIQLENTLLVDLYKTTIHWHELTIAMEELVEKGLMESSNLRKYNPIFVSNALKSMQVEILERWDTKTHDRIVSNVDLSFLDNKPKKL